jgi:O-antigen/teichoic acid export membrane protein
VVGGAIKAASVGLSFLFFLALAHAMTLEAFGTFSAAYSLAVGLSYLAMIGQHIAILRFWPAIEEKLGRDMAAHAVSRGLVLTGVGGLVTAAAVAAVGLTPGAATLFGGSRGDFAWTGLLVLAAAIAEFGASALRARGSLVFALAPRDIAWRLAVILLVQLFQPLSTETALAIVTLTLVAACIPQLVSLFAEIWRSHGLILPATERAAMRKATFGYWANTSISPVFDHSATVLVAAALGPAAAGAFFAADRLAKLLSLMLDGIEMIGGPMLARSFHAGRFGEVRVILGATSALALAGATVGAVGFIFFGQFALSLFNPAYADFVPVLLILAAGQVVNAVCGSNAIFLNMAGRERDLLAVRAVWGVISLVSVYFAAMVAGAVGAAIASSASLAGWNLTAVLVCKWRFGLSALFVDLLAHPPWQKQPAHEAIQ